MGAKGGGGTELSSQEKNLVNSQTQLLDQARGIITGAHGNFENVVPELLRLAGYEAQQNPRYDELTKKADERERAFKEWKAKQKDLGSSEDKQYIAQEEAAIARLRERAGSRLDGVTSTGPQQLDLAKVPGGDMPRLENLSSQIFRTLNQNIKTFDPNRPDPFVEEQLRRAREAETERLQSRLGPGADVSSAGLESLRNLDLNETLSRDAARRANFDMQLKQFNTLGGLGLATTGEMYNRRAGLRGEANNNTMLQEGFRQQRLSELATILQMPLSFAGPLQGTAAGFNSPLAAYAGARQPAGPSAGQSLAGIGGGGLTGAASGAAIGTAVGSPGIGTAAGAAIGGLAGLLTR